MKKLLVMTLAAGIALTATASVAGPLEDAIDARRGYYQVVKFNAGPLFAMAKGNVDYDAEAASTYAANLAALAQMNTAAMWPAGSDNEAMAGKTRALPVIWSTFPAVLDKNKAFTDAAVALGAAAGNGLDALRPAVGALGQSCSGCHDTYRAKGF